MATSYKVLNVYTTGYPNYFLYGVEETSLSTYSLINNGIWIKSSTDFSQAELNRLFKIDVGNFYVHE